MFVTRTWRGRRCVRIRVRLLWSEIGGLILSGGGMGLDVELLGFLGVLVLCFFLLTTDWAWVSCRVISSSVLSCKVRIE